jgi:menaquinone-dependent protoporphyrinogen IX oxidase
MTATTSEIKEEIKMNDRAKTLIANLGEIIRANRHDLYNQEFKEYLMKSTGITPEELEECGVFGKEADHD